MFAGPNGSGKSTLKTLVPPELLGIYINPDEIAAAIVSMSGLKLGDFGIESNSAEVKEFLGRSSFLQSVGAGSSIALLTADGDSLHFPVDQNVGYLASGISDYIRTSLLSQKRSFSFETVMSSMDKVAFMKQAQSFGYRTYLYYVATKDPQINVSRVAARVKKGGHPVPEDKVVSRYFRSLDLLAGAIIHSNRAYFFDNSEEGRDLLFVAETESDELHLHTDAVPAWFEINVLQKLNEELAP